LSVAVVVVVVVVVVAVFDLFSFSRYFMRAPIALCLNGRSGTQT